MDFLFFKSVQLNFTIGLKNIFICGKTVNLLPLIINFINQKAVHKIVCCEN